jgi:hypothetical protein
MTTEKPICTDACLTRCPLLTELQPDGTRALRAGLKPEQAETVLDIARRALHLTHSTCEEPQPMRPMYLGGPPGVRCDQHPEVVSVAEAVLRGVEEGSLGVNSLAMMMTPQPEV